jgi:hypothetical protein
MIFVIAALRSAKVYEIMDELDCCDPLHHFESRLIFATQPQWCAKQHAGGRTVRVEADLVDQLFNSSEERLARALILLANFGKEDRSELVITKASQEILAEMIGTTHSRVSFFYEQVSTIGLDWLQRPPKNPQLHADWRLARRSSHQLLSNRTPNTVS